jgi:Spy/CpxP family protein refolding chaperone
MFRARLLLCLALTVLIVGGSLFGDDKAPPKRGILPAGWRKLGLSDEQKQKVFAVQERYRGQIRELESKIKELRARRQDEMMSVLTPDQRQQLRKLALEKAPAEPGSKDKKGK